MLRWRTTQTVLSLAVLIRFSGCGGSPDAASVAAPGPTGIVVSPVTLEPPFSPSIHDYVVRCAAGKNRLTIEMMAQGGTTRLVEPASAEAAEWQSVDVELDEDQPVVVEMTTRDDAGRYWIRCLPHDFPVITATHHASFGTTSPGWYLVSSTVFPGGASGFAMIVDANGTPVWYRRSSTASGVLNVDLLRDGTISYSPLIDYTLSTTTNAKYELYHLDPPETKSVGTVGIPTDHHELRQLENGHYLLLSDVVTTGVDLTGLQSFGPDASIVNCAIQEVDEDGTVFWDWLATDHVDAARESMAPTSLSIEGTKVVDPFHCNSIDVDDDGNLLVSARHMNSVFLIDKTTGTVRWKLGGSPENKDHATYVRIEQDPETAFYLQHDARFRPNGNISLFDDHGTMPGPARCVEYAIDLTRGVATVAWQSAGAVNSLALGSCRRYEDGANVIGWGLVSGGPSLILSEVDASGNDLFDLEFTPSGSSYRAIKVPASALDADILRKAAALP